MDFLQSEYHTPCRRLLLTTPSQRESINDEIATLPELSLPVAEGDHDGEAGGGPAVGGPPHAPRPQPGEPPLQHRQRGRGVSHRHPAQQAWATSHCITLLLCSEKK